MNFQLKRLTSFYRYVLLLAIFLTTCTSAIAQYKEPEEKEKVDIIYPEAAFDSLQAKKMLARGTATIKGVAFTKIKNSLGFSPLMAERIYANQIKVVLLPVTPYFEEWHKLRDKKENLKKKRYVYLSDEAYRYRLEAITNSKGKFTFPEMKPGKYFLQGILGYTTTGSYNEYTGSGYSNDGYTTDYYQKKQYSVAHEDRIETFVEVKADGELVNIKLK
ncbi:hypothetical protein MTO98_19400 [Mucilaginibacter sp. SMC90]|uniref:hypothetical protein n=1 Tax=Mucilaginibacter sp. SMC90 TaxID=2929803 RepID=UPI001FB3DA0F|nr:hypothetical protein [Mucilaginibacter sp. SMC90]UOE46572.1 hypothetical protein MTO98_19400 [Mucilaginibacter sp. SMC90]